MCFRQVSNSKGPGARMPDRAFEIQHSLFYRQLVPPLRIPSSRSSFSLQYRECPRDVGITLCGWNNFYSWWNRDHQASEYLKVQSGRLGEGGGRCRNTLFLLLKLQFSLNFHILRKKFKNKQTNKQPEKSFTLLCDFLKIKQSFF